MVGSQVSDVSFQIVHIERCADTEMPQDRKWQEQESRWNWHEEYLAVQNCSELAENFTERRHLLVIEVVLLRLVNLQDRLQRTAEVMDTNDSHARTPPV